MFGEQLLSFPGKVRQSSSETKRSFRRNETLGFRFFGGAVKRTFRSSSQTHKRTMPALGEPIIIKGGIYAGLKGWIDPNGKKTKEMASVIVEVEEGVRKHTKIYKNSFILKKDKKTASTVTAKLLEGQPQVAKDLDAVAKKMARLGIVDGREATEMFNQLVNTHIAALRKKGPKANYFPVKIEEGMYRAFYDSPGVASNDSVTRTKHTFDDPNRMNNA